MGCGTTVGNINERMDRKEHVASETFTFITSTYLHVATWYYGYNGMLYAGIQVCACICTRQVNSGTWYQYHTVHS